MAKKKPIKKKAVKKKAVKKRASTKWIDPMEKRHRDMLGLNGEEAYMATYGY
jgi:hypothetical protein